MQRNASLRIALLAGILFARIASPQVIINSVAGGGSDDGVPATQAHLPVLATPILVDAGGSIYFPENSQIRKISPDGILHTIAGTGVTGFSGDGGPAISAQLSHPGQVATDAQGDLFFPDNGRIRRISPDGTISTIAGNGLPGTAVTDGPALSTPLDSIDGIAVDSRGNVYIAEPLSNRIREITTSGTISLFSGAPGGSASDGDSGPAVLAHLSTPILAGIDSSDNVYIYEGSRFLGPSVSSIYSGGYLIRKISSAGIISTFAGSASVGSAIESGQSALNAWLYQITGAAVAPSGAVYISVKTSTNEGNLQIYTTSGYRITPDSLIYPVTGVTGSVLGTDNAGNVYYPGAPSIGVPGIILAPGQALFLASSSGVVSLVAGGATFAAPDGTAARAAFIDPAALTIDSTGHVTFAEFGSCLIRTIGDDGALHTIAGTGKCSTAVSLSGGPALSTNLVPIQSLAAAPDGTIYFTDAYGPASGTIYRLLPNGQISQFAGNSFSGVAVDSKGNVFADTAFGNFGGTAAWFSPAGTLEGEFSLAPGPYNVHVGAIALDASDNLYLFDRSVSIAFGEGMNYRVLEPPSYAVSAPPIDLASFYLPIFAGAVDAAGNLYVNGNSNSLYRAVGGKPPASFIGNGAGFLGDGGLAQSAFYNTPGAIAAGSGGDIFFIDRGNFRIRMLTGSLPAVPPSLFPNGVVNSASYKGGTIAPGEMVSLFGSNLAPATFVNNFPNNLLPQVAGNTRVLFNQIWVPILSVTPGQINAIVPQSINGAASANIQVEVDGVLSQTITVPVAPASPGLFTADASGSGPGSIVNQDGTINSAANPAARGTTVSLYGTGAGAMTPQLADGYLNLSAPFGTMNSGATATVAGQGTTVSYAGGAPFLVAGAFQMNVLLPTNIPAGATDLVVSIASVPSNHVSVWTK